MNTRAFSNPATPPAAPDQDLRRLLEEAAFGLEQALGAFEQNWAIDWGNFESLSERLRDRAEEEVRIKGPKTTVHQALVQIFGAEPEKVIVTNPDHFSITCDLRQLCIAVGGGWAKLVSDLEARMAEMKTKRDPGARTAE